MLTMAQSLPSIVSGQADSPGTWKKSAAFRCFSRKNSTCSPSGTTSIRTLAAHKLVTSHLRLVAKIAMGYRGYGLPIGEAISEGNVGLMQAVKKFEPERGFRLRPMRCGGSRPRFRNTSCVRGAS